MKLLLSTIFYLLLTISLASSGGDKESMGLTSKTKKQINKKVGSETKGLIYNNLPSGLKNSRWSFRIKFSKMNIGKMEYKVENILGKVVTTAELKTNSFYDYIFKIRDKLTSSFNLDKGRPDSFRFVKKEGKRTSDVKMNFHKNGVHFTEVWTKKKRKGSQDKKIEFNSKTHVDILTMMNSVIFSKSELKKGQFFFTSLKEKVYKVVLKNKFRSSAKHNGKRVESIVYEFQSYKGTQLEKRGEFKLVVLPLKKPVLFEIEGRMKIGKLQWILTHAE